MQIETILHTALKFHFDRDCFREQKHVQTLVLVTAATASPSVCIFVESRIKARPGI